MNLRDALLARISEYLAARNMSERAFGIAAVKDHRFLVRLRANKTTLNRIGRAEAYMAENPPRSDEPDRQSHQRSAAHTTQPIQSAEVPQPC